MNQSVLSLFQAVPGQVAVTGQTTGFSIADPRCCIGLAVLLATLGIWLLVPGNMPRGRKFGALLALVSGGLFFSILPAIGPVSTRVLFYVLSAVTVISAVATISMRSAVYSAIWFALTLVGTAGLMVLQGAQFVGLATIVVYAGAILVTLLFVIMLAQPDGHDYYDRINWGRLPAALSAFAGAAMVGLLTLTLGGLAENESLQAAPRTTEILADEHVAHLGAQLFSRHLISIELAGTLLLVALVGAVAIAIQGKPSPDERCPNERDQSEKLQNSGGASNPS